LRGDSKQTGNESEVATIDQHVGSGQHAVQEIVRFRLPSSTIQSVSLRQERRIRDGWWWGSSDNVKLRVGSDEKGEESESLLVRQMAEKTRKESLAFRRVHE